MSKKDVDNYLEKDAQIAVNESKKLYQDFDNLPLEVQYIIANMMFNLGYTKYNNSNVRTINSNNKYFRLSKFKNMKSAVEAGDWARAADEMVHSDWYKQVGNRAKDLVERMRNVQ